MGNRVLTRVLVTGISALCGLAVLAGPSVTLASAITIDAPPADCATLMAHTQTAGTTKTFISSQPSSGSTTYFFDIQSADTASTNWTTAEDCAYVASTPSNIKYGTQTQNPVFTNGHATISLTIDSADTICDRVELTGTKKTGGAAVADYTNLVGSGNGGSDPQACSPPAFLPEVPAAGLLAVAGLGVAGAALFVWRRRDPLIASEG